MRTTDLCMTGAYARALLVLVLSTCTEGCTSARSDRDGTIRSAQSLDLPDFVVTEISMSPPNPAPGDAVTFTATVKNQGNVDSSEGALIGVSFLVDGTQVSWADRFTSSLAAGASASMTADWGPQSIATWTATAGAHTVQAVVDDVDRIQESDESNNATALTFQIGGPPLPDVIVTGITMSSNGVGDPVIFTAQVRNQGNAPTPPATIIGVSFLIDGAQVSWSAGDTRSLAPGESVSLAADWGPFDTAAWTATSGTHTLQAWVDDVNRFPESDESNNIFTTTIEPSGGPPPDAMPLFFDDFRTKTGVDWTKYTAVQPGYDEHGTMGPNDVWWIVPNNSAESDPRLNPFSFDSTNGLTISVLETPPDLLGAVGGSHYITSQLVPRNYYPTFGFFEWKAQAALGPGIVSALWLYNNVVGGIGEIDVLEMVGNDATQTVHTATVDHGISRDNYLPDGAAVTAWHLYSVEWQSDFIDLYFDNTRMQHIPTPPDCRAPFFIIMSVNASAPGDDSWYGHIVPGQTPLPAPTRIQYFGHWKDKATADRYFRR